MKSPIVNKINTIFVHVTNLKESVKWYSELLGLKINLAKVIDPVFNLEVNHFTGLTLDAGETDTQKSIDPSEHPLFNFHTDSIEEAYAFVRGKGFELDSEIVRFDDFSFFTVKDPDQNVIMICTG